MHSVKGLSVKGYLFNVTIEEEVIKGLDIIENEVGQIDILVNNAGIIKRIPAVEMEVDDFRQVIDVDLVGPFIMAKNVVKRLIEKGKSGKIINICSMMSELGRDTVSAYASAKGGLGYRSLIETITTDDTLRVDESGKTIVCTPAASSVNVMTVTLPTAAQGLTYTIVAGSADTIAVDSQAGDYFEYLDLGSGQAIANSSAMSSDCITVTSPAANKWYIVSDKGTWVRNNP